MWWFKKKDKAGHKYEYVYLNEQRAYKIFVGDNEYYVIGRDLDIRMYNLFYVSVFDGQYNVKCRCIHRYGGWGIMRAIFYAHGSGNHKMTGLLLYQVFTAYEKSSYFKSLEQH